MKRSPRIEAVLRKLISESGEEAFRSILARSPDLISIGTDEREFHHGYTEVAQVNAAQAEEIDPLPAKVLRLYAYEEGDVGWAAGMSELTKPDGETFLLRFTSVLMHEEGRWRVIQFHHSIGVPNEDLYGYELTTSISGLVSSLASEDADAVARAVPSGTATLMFTDIEGSTPLSQAMGDTAWSAFVTSHFETLDAVVAAHGGSVVKTLGDGGMFAFGSARAAIAAAVDIQHAVASTESEWPFAVRIGVHTGEVHHTEADYFGLAVSKAARIAGAARGGEIMVSTVTAELAGSSEFDFGEPTAVELRGLEGTHRIRPLIW